MHAGGPNSNDSNSNKLLHHTIGLLDREQELRCFQQVTCAQVTHTRLSQYPPFCCNGRGWSGLDGGGAGNVRTSVLPSNASRRWRMHKGTRKRRCTCPGQIPSMRGRGPLRLRATLGYPMDVLPSNCNGNQVSVQTVASSPHLPAC